MAKRKKGLGKRLPDDLEPSILRDLNRGNLKDAVKKARVAYRKGASDGCRLLLQRACLARAEQLHQHGLSDQAREMLQEFASLGQSPVDLERQRRRLLALLGATASNDGREEANLLDDPQIRTELADQAVLRGSGPSLPSDLRPQVGLIRNALKQLESDQLDGDIVELQSIDRQSPLADWKLFVRGLMAYYAQDDQRALANWSRLDASRPAHRIAQGVMLAAGLVREKDVPPETRSRAQQLTSLEGNGVLVRDVKTFQRHWKSGDWGSLARIYSRIANRYRISHPELVEKLGSLIAQRIVKEERQTELRRLSQISAGPPFDPRFNRVNALVAESYHLWPDAQKSWLAFLEDLRQSGSLSDGDRSTATGLIYQRVGDNCTLFAKDQGVQSVLSETDELWLEQQRLISEACEFFELSLQHAPSLRDTYYMYADTLEEFGEHPKKVERVYRRLLEEFPEDVDALLTAAEHYLDHQQFADAKRCARTALRVQPRDDRGKAILWRACVTTARVAARAREFAVARAELDEAEPFSGPGRDRYVLDAYRAAIELKAENSERAEEILATVLRHFDQPAVGLLMVSAQAFRVGVSRGVRNDLNARLKQELAGAKRTSHAAGAMARFLNALERTDSSYRGIRTHGRMLTKYLKACTRIRWEVQDLIDVCEFLSNEPQRLGTFDRLARRGRSRFSMEPYFYFAEGQIEMLAGPMQCNPPKAQAAFERAIELSKTAERPLNELQSQQASRALDLLQGSSPMMSEFDFIDDEECDFPDESHPEDELCCDPPWIDLEELWNNLPARLRRTLERLDGQTKSTLLDRVRKILAQNSATSMEIEGDDISTDSDQEPQNNTEEMRKLGN